MARLRLGVALLLPPPVADEVDGLRRALGDRSLGRVPPHVTLVPPVNVRADDLGRALAVLRAAAAATPSRLTVTLGPPTTFLPVNPVVYLPVAGAGEVAALRRRVWEPPLTRTLTWPFVAHVTLADDASAERIEAAVAALADYTAVVTFDRVHLLMEHRLSATGHSARGSEGRRDPTGMTAGATEYSPGPPGKTLARSERRLGSTGMAGGGTVGRLDPTGMTSGGTERSSSSPQWRPLADYAFGPPAIVARGGPLAVTLVRSHQIDPEARALLDAENTDLAPPGPVVQGPLVVTARREGAVVGVAIAWLTPSGLQSSVFVATAHRRQGIGRHLQAALAVVTGDAGWTTGT